MVNLSDATLLPALTIRFAAGINKEFPVRRDRKVKMNNRPPLQLTIVYDNNPHEERLETDWGFSCFIQGLEKNILFDTGTQGRILLSNMDKIGIQPDAVDLVILSHNHRDHTGGLEALLGQNSKIQVWLPSFFPSSLKEGAREKGAELVEVKDFQKIFEGAYTTGVVEGWIKEQSLILEAASGIIVITGCAHPRITKILSLTKEQLKQNIYLALGGFHLAGFDKNEIKAIIAAFRDLSVKKAGPCHCSGDEARKYFGEEYKENFIQIGVGTRIEVR